MANRLNKEILITPFILIGLYLTSFYSYLLFHSLVEIFTVIVMCGIFMVAWNSRKFLDNHYLLFLGIAYLFVAIIDTIHTLAYTGMNVFREYDSNLPTQLWISARYIQSVSLLMAPLFIKKKLNQSVTFFTYLALTAVIILTILFLRIFPDCYIEGIGLTLFKKISEYLISAVLLISAILLYSYKNLFEKHVLSLLIISILFSILSELFFTGYFSVYDLFNLTGHFLKLISSYLIYKAIIKTGLEKPYDILFRNLKKSEEALRISEKKYKTLFDSSADLIIVYDFNGNIKDANEVACNYLGYKHEQLTKMAQDDIEIQHEPSFSTDKTKEPSRNIYESFYKKNNGNVFPVEINSRVIEYSGTKAILSIIRDITLRRELEDKISRMRRENEAFLRHEILCNFSLK